MAITDASVNAAFRARYPVNFVGDLTNQDDEGWSLYDPIILAAAVDDALVFLFVKTGINAGVDADKEELELMLLMDCVEMMLYKYSQNTEMYQFKLNLIERDFEKYKGGEAFTKINRAQAKDQTDDKADVYTETHQQKGQDDVDSDIVDWLDPLGNTERGSE